MTRIRGSKYGAKRCVYEGMDFDSQLERDRYMVLCTFLRAGTISKLERQITFTLTVGDETFKIIPDFAYLEGQKVIIEDAKGLMCGPAWSLFKLKWALLKAKYPEYEYRIWTKDGHWNGKRRSSKRRVKK